LLPAFSFSHLLLLSYNPHLEFSFSLVHQFLLFGLLAKEPLRVVSLQENATFFKDSTDLDNFFMVQLIL
jgi:hypothetical protein